MCEKSAMGGANYERNVEWVETGLRRYSSISRVLGKNTRDKPDLNQWTLDLVAGARGVDWSFESLIQQFEYKFESLVNHYES